MSDPKDRFYRVRREAIKRLTRTGLRVVILHDEIFDIEATDEDTIRKIKICLDAAPRAVHDKIAQALLPCSCRRQIWLKREDASNFEIIRIKPCQ